MHPKHLSVRHTWDLAWLTTWLGGRRVFRNQSLPMIAAAILVASCAAQGPAFTDAPPPSTKALVYIYRQPGFVLGAQPAGFKLDERPVATLDSGGYSFFHLAPGRYELKQFWPASQSFANPLLWSPGLSEDIKIPLDVKAGETRYFRMGAYVREGAPNSVNVRWYFSEVLGDTARREIVQEKFQAQDKNMPAELRP